MERLRESIHYHRRWFYVLWSGLLLASLTALGLWETPKRSGIAGLTLRLKVKEMPPQTQIQIWTGPRGRWPGAAWTGQGAAAILRPADDQVNPDLPLSVGYRRWVKDIIPRRTADLVVLRFAAPGQAPHYLALPLRDDWRSGLLTPGRKMRLAAEFGWAALETDPSGFATLE